MRWASSREVGTVIRMPLSLPSNSLVMLNGWPRTLCLLDAPGWWHPQKQDDTQPMLPQTFCLYWCAFTKREMETPSLQEGHFSVAFLKNLYYIYWLIGKDPNAGKDWRQEEKGTTEDEMVGWHHWLDGHEFEWTLGVGDGQEDLACCSPWGRKELDTAEQLNWTDNIYIIYFICIIIYVIKTNSKYIL